jgi:C-terminal processing protease CtpA/Prc
MINHYIDDIHTSYSDCSYNSSYNGDDDAYQALKSQTNGTSKQRIINTMMELIGAYNKKYPDGVKCYEEVGDTAYITFSDFRFGYAPNGYLAKPTDEEVANNSTVDTVRLMQYAFDKVSENKNIKKVVLDLSMNNGGVVTAGMFVLGTFLGEGVMTTKNTITGAMSNSAYKVDVNRDGEFDEKDSFQSKEFQERGLQLFCFTSNWSFSCANLVPSFLKDSKKVTIVGQTSGGGSCAVGSLTTASGTSFNISSPYRFSFLKNGSFYDVDRGVDPDVYVKDLAKLYDREYMNTVLDKVN